VINLDVLGPFQVLKPALTLRPKETKRGSEKAGPVGWWKLDESGGTTAANAAGASLAGQFHGAPRWAPDQGRQQGAVEFGPASGWIECTESADLYLRDSVAVAVWMKTRAGEKGGVLLAKGASWRLQRSGGKGEVEFTLTGPQTSGASKGKPPRVVCKQALNDGQWHHLVATYDGKRIALYVDGVEADAVTASGTLALNNLPVTLGENAASRGRPWNGWLDDVRLYDRGLSPQEVRMLWTEVAGR
jgi:hypothetical protein